MKRERTRRGDSLFYHDRPEQSPGFLLWQVNNLWQRNIQQALRPLDLTHVQFVLLANIRWLEERDGVVTQSMLASHARTDPMMTSQVVRKLEERKLLTRNPHPEDSRAVQLALTASGTRLIAEALTIVESADRQFFSLSAKEEAHLLDLLNRLRAGS